MVKIKKNNNILLGSMLVLLMVYSEFFLDMLANIPVVVVKSMTLDIVHGILLDPQELKI